MNAGNKLLAGFESALEHLKQERADHYDPVRFARLVSLSERAIRQRENVARKIAPKLELNLAEYREDYEAALAEAALMADQLDYQFPNHKEQIQHLFESREFRQLKRLAEKLRHEKHAKEGNLAQLVELKRQLTELGLSAQAEASENSLNDQLKQQELDALKELLPDFTASHTTARNGNEHSTIRLFKAAKEKQYIDDIVSQAMRDKPENPGPINPHMLAIRSLSLMQSLSPAYLGKFVQTMDTLFWLEEAKSDNSK